MRPLIAAALLLTTTPAVAQRAPEPAIAARCKPAEGLVEYKGAEPARPRPLTEMPPAVEIKALWRGRLPETDRGPPRLGQSFGNENARAERAAHARTSR